MNKHKAARISLKIDQAGTDENDLLFKYVKSSLPLAIFLFVWVWLLLQHGFHKPGLYSAHGTGTSECF